jgi:hypothetical protein
VVVVGFRFASPNWNCLAEKQGHEETRNWRRRLHDPGFNVDAQKIGPLVACASCPRRVGGA